MQQIIADTHPELVPYTDMLLAHLLTENGALAENIHGDWIDKKRPCSMGIPQISTCIHFKMNVYRYLEEHPELREWRNQFAMYLDWMSKRLEKYGNIDTAVRSWNFNAGIPYLSKVKRNVATVDSLLSL